MKDAIDTSYNRLLDISDIATDRMHNHNHDHNKEKLMNKTTEMHNVTKQANLKNSGKNQNHSYLSTPMLLIQKEKKPANPPQILKRKNEKKSPKKSLKYGLKSNNKIKPGKTSNPNNLDSS